MSTPAPTLRRVPRRRAAPVWASRRAAIETRMEAALEDALGQASTGPATAVLVDELRSFVRRPGKRVRPMLMLDACAAFGGDVDRAVPVAAALELLHAFILAHDDVIDRSDQRSGRPTLHRSLQSRLGLAHDRERVGRDLAIVLGDVLFSTAQRALLRSDFPAETKLRALDAILHYLTETGLGECEDIAFGAWDISRLGSADIERMYWLKTTRYSIECPLVLGAILAGRSPAVAEELGEVARPLGLALQIRNDLDAFRQFEVSDAVVPDDFLEGKKTLLMAAAHEALDEGDRRLLQLCLGQRPPTEAALGILRELVVKSRAVGRLEARAATLVGEACARLAGARLPASARRALADAFERIGLVLDCRTLTAA